MYRLKTFEVSFLVCISSKIFRTLYQSDLRYINKRLFSPRTTTTTLDSFFINSTGTEKIKFSTFYFLLKPLINTIRRIIGTPTRTALVGIFDISQTKPNIKINPPKMIIKAIINLPMALANFSLPYRYFSSTLPSENAFQNILVCLISFILIFPFSQLCFYIFVVLINSVDYGCDKKCN